jgi:hypothetical protein
MIDTCEYLLNVLKKQSLPLQGQCHPCFDAKTWLKSKVFIFKRFHFGRQFQKVCVFVSVTWMGGENGKKSLSFQMKTASCGRT